jgi:hypothetical protein
VDIRIFVALKKSDGNRHIPGNCNSRTRLIILFYSIPFYSIPFAWAVAASNRNVTSQFHCPRISRSHRYQRSRPPYNGLRCPHSPVDDPWFPVWQARLWVTSSLAYVTADGLVMLQSVRGWGLNFVAVWVVAQGGGTHVFVVTSLLMIVDVGAYEFQ